MNSFRDIGSTIQTHVEAQGFSLFPMKNLIFSLWKKGTEKKKKGMTHAGNYETRTLNDGWTAGKR